MDGIPSSSVPTPNERPKLSPSLHAVRNRPNKLGRTGAPLQGRRGSRCKRSQDERTYANRSGKGRKTLTCRMCKLYNMSVHNRSTRFNSVHLYPRLGLS